MLYFKDHLNQHSATASKNVNNWIGTCYITPLIGAFLADAYLGRYRTIAAFSILYVFVSSNPFILVPNVIFIRIETMFWIYFLSSNRLNLL